MNMNEKQLLLLWQLRFEKMLSNEEKSLLLYKALLREYDHLLSGSRIKHIIRKIMREEAGHIKIAERLLEIVQQCENGIKKATDNNEKGCSKSINV